MDPLGDERPHALVCRPVGVFPTSPEHDLVGMIRRDMIGDVIRDVIRGVIRNVIRNVIRAIMTPLGATPAQGIGTLL